MSCYPRKSCTVYKKIQSIIIIHIKFCWGWGRDCENSSIDAFVFHFSFTSFMLLSFIGTHGYIKDTPEPLVNNIIQKETIICVLNTFCFLYKNQPYKTFQKNPDIHTADERGYIYISIFSFTVLLKQTTLEWTFYSVVHSYIEPHIVVCCDTKQLLKGNIKRK